ncbi:MAG: altronate dehydratase family protein [Eubacteriales bacterium]|nr:altronate dehydratase family protein [Eubacteriales bacterium]
MEEKKSLKIHESDNVGVALSELSAGDECLGVTLRERIQRGHKFALSEIGKGESVIKYGQPIGRATTDIGAGEWVHTHDMETALTGRREYKYEPEIRAQEPCEPLGFYGYRRADGRVGIRNEIWIIPLVGCVNDVCGQIEERVRPVAERLGLDGVHHFAHPYGCSQLGDDHENTRRILADLAGHPNAGGVLCVSLGCENNTPGDFRKAVGDAPGDRIRYMVCQDVTDEVEEGVRLCTELCELASGDRRTECSAGDLVIGLKCGGSDGLSGITANPVVGRLSDRITAMGGTTILTEVPEMFGAEESLMNRAGSRELFEKAADMVNGFKEYFISHGQPVGENPSPGNREGGITTLEDKSLGCVQKGGTSPVRGVLGYGDTVGAKGLNMLCAPGNDLVSSTALAAAGAQMVLFTTGRGTPFSSPAPTVKISTNTALYNKKRNWIDFNAGVVAEGTCIDDAADDLLEYVLRVAGGERTCSERNGQHGIAIWKNGVTL